MKLSQKEIKVLLKEWNLAWNKHDLDKVMMLFHDDVFLENWTGAYIFRFPTRMRSQPIGMEFEEKCALPGVPSVPFGCRDTRLEYMRTVCPHPNSSHLRNLHENYFICRCVYNTIQSTDVKTM